MSEGSREQYLAELQRWGVRLAFDAPLEAEFLRNRDERSIWLLRFGCAIAVFLYTSYVLMDLAFQRRLTEPWIYVLIFAIASPATVAPALATFHPRLRHRTRALALAATILNAVTLILVIGVKTRQGQTFPYEVLILSMLYTFFLGGILFRAAFPTACVTAVVFLLVEWLAGRDLIGMLDRGFAMAATVILAGMSCYLLERTERRRWLQGQLVNIMAVRDDLTGLYNRRHFYDEGNRLLREARREGKALGLLVLDVDQFKPYNDALGHLAGDECLQRVADALRSLARRPLDLAARTGGEEFVLMLFDTEASAVRAQAERLRSAIEARAIPHPQSPYGRVTVSIGAASVPAGSTLPLEGLLAAADRALYAAKADGRNRLAVAAL